MIALGRSEAPTAAVIKHTNPCGCAQAQSLAEAFARARAADTVSAFGGILTYIGWGAVWGTVPWLILAGVLIAAVTAFGTLQRYLRV